MASDKIEKLESKARQLDNLKEREDERGEALATVLGFGGARIASRLLTTLIPGLAGLMPLATILGGAYFTMRGVDPTTKDRGMQLGIGLGLGTSIVDKIGDFMVDTAKKFKGGGGSK